LLASLHRLAERVLERVPASVAAEARANIRAGAALYEHASPLDQVPDLRTRRPEPADVLLGYFNSAEDRFGVEWEVLAAVMLIETRMGRVVSRSSAGAQGPMQFLPATWEAYGLGGDVQKERDAVMGAANYLAASGAPSDYREALYRYNPVDAYVTAVTRYAKAMRRDPDAFYAYYNWQVFVRTTTGDVRLTGPGLD
jgi:soluble lytic murein transglycosylase-like protein